MRIAHKVGQLVKFVIKDGDSLVHLLGEVVEVLDSRTAKRRGLINARQTGRVIGIEVETGKVYYKYSKVCKPAKGKVLWNSISKIYLRRSDKTV